MGCNIMKKIIIAGASTYGVKNAGDDAMFNVLCETLKEEIPGVELVFLARHPNSKFDKVFGVRSIKNFEHNNREESLGRFFYGFNDGDDPKRLGLIKKEIEDSDFVVIGGNSFMEVSENEFLRGVSSYSSTLAIMAKILGKPYVLYGVHGHPLKTDLTKSMARFLCNNSELVTLREDFYREELLKLGIKSNKLKTFADPAFGLNAIKDKEKGQKIIDEEGIKFNSKIVIGVCFRHMYWLWSDEDYNKYSAKMAELCDYAIEKIGAEILFIPNCTYNIDDIHEDDRLTCQFVKDQMRNKDKTHIIKADLELPGKLAMYSHLDMVLSNRRHVSTAAATHGVPFIAMSTGHMWQFEPFMKRLNLDSQQLISFVDEDLNSMKKKIDYVWENKKEIKERIVKSMVELKAIARGQTKEIINVIKGKK